MASKVYFMNDRAGGTQDTTQHKAVKLLRDAGLREMIKPGDRVAIKVHMGEWGNSMNTRPRWYGAIVDEVKRCGGIPTIVETCTGTYGEVSSRWNREDHLRVAKMHGFTEETMGCPIDIMDGDYGMESVKVPVPNGVYLKNALMAKGMLRYDKYVIVSHFKGHDMGDFGGALKNVGVGMASGHGKMIHHSLINPKFGMQFWQFNQAGCAELAKQPHPNQIDRMIANCPHNAMKYENGIMSKDPDKCHQCGYCMGYYWTPAYIQDDNVRRSWPPALVDAAAAFITNRGKDNFIFVNYMYDITPTCDCVAFHDRVMLPNIGVAASRDPVALDMACVEMCEALRAVDGSRADELGFGEPNTERFTNVSCSVKASQWGQLYSGVQNGIGTTEYILVNSHTEPSGDFTFPPYDVSTNNTGYAKWKPMFATIPLETEDFNIDGLNPTISFEQLAIKPKGKVGEIDISEES